MVTFTMQQVRDFKVPAGAMTLWWLGQTGFIVKSPGGKIVAIDPYLSNSCKAIGEQAGLNMDRMVPPPIRPADLVGIDAYAITHSHQDHLDPETLGPYRTAGGTGPFVAPAETVEKLQAMGVPQSQTVMVWPNKSLTIGDLTLRATFAIPFAGDDLTHVGYLVCIQGGPKLYVSGDTGYHEILAVSLAEHKPDVAAVAINPAFRNMSPIEGACLAQRIGAKVVVPCHYDLFPDNSLPPQLLRTNLMVLGIAERYRALEHGRPFTYPEPRN
jgi:L-ascorbate 6-phosphate lactonase